MSFSLCLWLVSGHVLEAREECLESQSLTLGRKSYICIRNSQPAPAAQAAKAIEHYHVHAVVANILNTRKEVVTLVMPRGTTGAPVERLIRRPADGQVIEAPLVAELVRLHAAYKGEPGAGLHLSSESSSGLAPEALRPACGGA